MTASTPFPLHRIPTYKGSDPEPSGGDLAGLPVKPGKALVVTEEPAEKWLERSRRFDFAGNVCWLCRPFAGKPRQANWQALIGQVLDLHHRFGLALAAIDPLASFLPFRSENDAGEMLAALLLLHRLTAEGLSVLLLHHPRKKPSADGQCSRGSGALCGFVDILLEMHWVGAAESEDRRRRVLAWSRHEETPRQRLMELSTDGRSYYLGKKVNPSRRRPACPGGALFDNQSTVAFFPLRRRPACPGGALFDYQRERTKALVSPSLPPSGSQTALRPGKPGGGEEESAFTFW